MTERIFYVTIVQLAVTIVPTVIQTIIQMFTLMEQCYEVRQVLYTI